MKKTKLLCLSLAAFALCITLFAGSSCTKEKLITERDTVERIVIQKDTIPRPDTIVDETMLTSTFWQMEEVNGVYGNSKLFYKRGNASYTQSYDKEYYVFHKDHTGFEIDQGGMVHNITSWRLTTTSGRTKLEMIYSNNTSGSIKSTITWDYLKIKNGNLVFNEYYFNNETYLSFHGQVIRSKKN